MPESTYSMIRNDGSPVPLNTYDVWTSSGDILQLPTGYYFGYVQTTNQRSEYVVAKNLPDSVDGFVVLLTVIDGGYEGRKMYQVTTNADNRTYTNTAYNNVLGEWGYDLTTTDSNPLQQYRLTFSTGVAPTWRWGLPNPDDYEGTNLDFPITDLNTGFYYGSINAMKNDNRNLPPNFPAGQYCSAIVWRNGDDRKSIILNAHFSHATWMLTTGVNSGLEDGTNLWVRLDKEEDLIGQDKAMFSIQMNKRSKKHFNFLAITDTHWQENAPTTQIGFVNPLHYNNIEDLDRQIKTNDMTVHLGDWIDGNYTKKLASYSMANLGAKFFEKPNRYGVIGNHDYNGQWNGNAGDNAGNKGDPDYQFTQDEIAPFMTPDGEPFYYKDHTDKKIRLIFLNCFDVPAIVNPITGKWYIDPQEQRAFGAEQVNFFIKALQTVPEGYNVLIFTHDVFNQVYDNNSFYNGNTVREIAEAYQAKTKANKITTGIGSSDPTFEYYDIGSCQNCVDFTESNGKILGVFAGHRHRDMTLVLNGIRYISLLCSRPESGTDDQKPTRNYYDKTTEAITFVAVDLDSQVIRLYRFGAGKNYTLNMFTN